MTREQKLQRIERNIELICKRLGWYRCRDEEESSSGQVRFCTQSVTYPEAFLNYKQILDLFPED